MISRATELQQVRKHERFFSFWQRARDIVNSRHGSLSQNILTAWTRAICCIAIDEVPASHQEAFVFVRNALISYRLSSRWVEDVAEELPSHLALSIQAAIIGEDDSSSDQQIVVRSSNCMPLVA